MCVAIIVKNHAAFGILYSVDEKTGLMKILCIKSKNEKWPERWVLPGGKQKGVETPLETAQREIRQECARDWKNPEAFHVELEEIPVKEFETPLIEEDADGVHLKIFFVENEIIGELRTEERAEPDEGGDILDAPTWLELSKVVEIFTAQGKKSFYPLQGILFALQRLASKDTHLAYKVAERYANLIPE